MNKEDDARELTEAQRGELLRRADLHRTHPNEAVALDDALRSIEHALENMKAGNMERN